MKHTQLPMKCQILRSAFRYGLFAISVLAVYLFSLSASALVMRENGPEPIIIQLKESLRLSDDLDEHLAQLETTRGQHGLNVVKWCAGNKLLAILSFPPDLSEQQALSVIEKIEQLPAVEKVVAASAANLEFKATDFGREYASDQAMPEHARRGLDKEELSRSPKAQAQIDEAAQLPHVPNQLIVRWKARHVWRATARGFLQDIANFHAAGGATVIKEMRSSPTELVQVIEFSDLVMPFADKLRRYVDCPWVDYAQPNFVYSATAVGPNDPLYTNPGQPTLPKISAASAWSITTGTQNLVVAVADTGANVNHPDLAPNISQGWRNFSVDPPNSDVTDEYSPTASFPFHGSHVASTIGAKGNNGQWMTGVTWNVSLLILKVISQNSTDSWKVANAINYAWSNDGHSPAIAINLSIKTLIGSGIDETVHDAVIQARDHNMVVVAAAGNFADDMDLPPEGDLVSPACIPTDNVISVGATVVKPGLPDDDTKAGYSNWGRYRVELGAPGGDNDACNYGVLGLQRDPTSTPAPACNTPNSVGWQRISGTSMAAPHVTGAIQLVKSKYPWENYAGLRDRVIMATDDVPALNGIFRTGGRLNMAKALKTRTLIKNWSTRAKVESGDRIIIGGFTIGGSPAVPLKVAIRGLGPSLPPLGVARLNDPKLQLNNSNGGLVFFNDDWGNLPPGQKTDLANANLTPGNPNEAAIVATLFPGSYTVLMQSEDGQQGVGLFELYELRGFTTEETRLRNISTRCPVGVGDENAIAGTFVQNPDISRGVPKRRLLMTGRGPSLQPFVAGTLPNPYLDLRNSAGAIIDFNDQWKDIDGLSRGLEAKLVESNFRPPPLPGVEQFLDESVLWPTLVPGSYTAVFRDSGGASGIGLIEFYEY